MNARHKNYDVIIAYAEGKKIEGRPNQYSDWQDIASPAFDCSWEFRVKPEKPQNIVKQFLLKPSPISIDDAYDAPNVEVTFSGEHPYKILSIRSI